MIDPSIMRTLAPGLDEEVKAFDAGGSLCGPPTGGEGCSWHASAIVHTDAGFAQGGLDFVSSGPGRPRSTCQGIPASVLFPHTGDTVSGTVAVSASVPEDGGCNISARSRVWVYSGRGTIVAGSGDIEYGDRWNWDTSRLGNGVYNLRAAPTCCLALGQGVEVTVRN